MYPYQLSKVLADEHIRDTITNAEHRRRRGETRKLAADQPASSWHLSDAVTHLLALLHVRTPAHTAAPRTSTPSAGPMGCVA